MCTNTETPKADVSKGILAENTTLRETPGNISSDDNDDNASVDSFGSDEVAREQSKYKDDKIEDVDALAKEMEQCYLEAVEEMKELEKLVPRFKALDKKTEKLFKYYFGGPWMSHRERIFEERPNSGYNVLGEDCIFDFYGDLNNLAKQNLKEMTLYLTDKKDF
ncbi:YALI0B17446p [Yarrowia lipolytica CLIB122]|uniref:YALI0B17446p n=2 Tax=Yarrowia lipolytica TaxID=4952 RepID=Q6CE95_YARLI|nr:YALI0B17446p [Yarrowia lipolytica CLIB122]AOW01840.1 hypothetical protein YALI1_B22645g [Yarrowia lipolytica]KAB8280788.1 hypothetical protein BKA91DRAFT_141284 [Yarrowia lipolytica]KAE8170028.1 hypothetical protein BKA90DRAFT_141522 [Yarrowia lipolytica]KAJ8052631.1 hypothetical protein LXG23DRAFT_25066 [Yarrowia lipolytica]RMJ01372.1 hypothetical protein BD777DRAFT_122229 [Yarrowia lipolytica]|eukprot:XP_501017.2 YALI0B17446p [Yarrowia lipolytica CLIB122]